MCDKTEVSIEKLKLNPSSKHFDRRLFLERRERLVQTTEKESLLLTHDERYDRIRYLTEDEAWAMMEKNQKAHDARVAAGNVANKPVQNRYKKLSHDQSWIA